MYAPTEMFIDDDWSIIDDTQVYITTPAGWKIHQQILPEQMTIFVTPFRYQLFPNDYSLQLMTVNTKYY